MMYSVADNLPNSHPRSVVSSYLFVHSLQRRHHVFALPVVPLFVPVSRCFFRPNMDSSARRAGWASPLDLYTHHDTCRCGGIRRPLAAITFTVSRLLSHSVCLLFLFYLVFIIISFHSISLHSASNKQVSADT